MTLRCWLNSWRTSPKLRDFPDTRSSVVVDLPKFASLATRRVALRNTTLRVVIPSIHSQQALGC